MSTTPDDRLYLLLPEYYRTTDAESGGALQALLRVIAEQVDVVQADIDQLYRNWFIETCQDWVVPYIGDLVGYRPLSLGEAAQSTTPEGERLLRASEPRADVARTIATRRRKGTAAVLVELARDVAGWPARAVEFYELLAQTQSINHVRSERGRTVDLRDGDLLDAAGTPFDRLAHTVDVRRVSSILTPGRFDIPEAGVFVWRLRCHSLTHTPSFCWDEVRNEYSFSILGNDTPLMTLPQAGLHAEPGAVDVPEFIRRRPFSESLFDYYGPSASLCVWRDDPGGEPIPADDIVAADLSDWAYSPQDHQVAVDPVLGRIAFGSLSAPKREAFVSYHVGFSADIGGGEYLRARPPIGARRVYTVAGSGGGEFEKINDAIDRWQTDKVAEDDAREAVIEVLDSRRYEESIEVVLGEGDQLEISGCFRYPPRDRRLGPSRPDGDRGHRHAGRGTSGDRRRTWRKRRRPRRSGTTATADGLDSDRLRRVHRTTPADVHAGRLPRHRPRGSRQGAGCAGDAAALHARPRVVAGGRLPPAACRASERRAPGHTSEAGGRTQRHRFDRA